ncbi:MAG: Rnase Y domain-containing protein, partial [Candidatus Parcubacteria bacterium]|nr:Rnase Y domain-containing protein [Candidatus Parcubacteria bacterium]
MNQFILLIAGLLTLVIGSILGYKARQSIAQKQSQTLEAKIQKRITEVKEQTEKLIEEAKQKASEIVNVSQKEVERKRTEFLKLEELLLKKEGFLEQKISNFDVKEKDFNEKVEKLSKIKENLEKAEQEASATMEKIAQMTKEEAKKELFENYEKEYQQEIMEKIKNMEREGSEKLEKKAKNILALVIQRLALSQSQELTTSTVVLPNDEMKGKIIGKEGRNIKTLEKLTGVEIIVDETPEAVVISGFDPFRRQIAKAALEKLIQDGRIQPARIEEIVAKTEKELQEQVKKAGEAAIYETGVIGLDPKIIQLLGRLRFRTSYGQNVLLHSMEVAFLASALAAEIGGNASVAKKAGLLHDIGKAVDHQVQGSHVDIGIKILERFGVEK